ncbi:MAG: DUF2007 domain-containing protein [Thalassotalea sp.]
MKMVYTNENQFIVNNVKNLIEAQGIKTFLKNEFSQGAVGEIAVFDAWPEIWVLEDAEHTQALKIAQLSQNINESPDWLCKQCKESNDASFEICWQCQSSNS